MFHKYTTESKSLVHKNESSVVAVKVSTGIVYAIVNRPAYSSGISTVVNKTRRQHLTPDDAAPTLLLSNALQLIARARNECSRRWLLYLERMTFANLNEGIFVTASRLMGSNPCNFNVGIVLAGVEDKKCELWYISEQNEYKRCDAVALGSDSVQIERYIKKHFKLTMTLQEAYLMVLSSLTGIVTEGYNFNRMDLVVLTPKKLFSVPTNDNLLNAFTKIWASKMLVNVFTNDKTVFVKNGDTNDFNDTATSSVESITSAALDVGSSAADNKTRSNATLSIGDSATGRNFDFSSDEIEYASTSHCSSEQNSFNYEAICNYDFSVTKAAKNKNFTDDHSDDEDNE